VLVEAAMAGALFFVTVFSIMDFGMAFYNRNSIQNMSLTAARTVAAQANDPMADFATLAKLAGTKGPFKNNELQAVVIYKATGPSSKIPVACKTGPSAASFCNYYVPSDLIRPSSDFPCSLAAAPDRFWCPTTRKAASTYTGGGTPGPEYIGVYVRGTYASLTGFLGNKTFETDTIIRIEPRIK
jgi:hypothetical protein